MSKMLVSAVFLAAFGYAQAAEKPSLTVTTPNDVVDPDDGLISLREAFKYAENDTPGIPGALSEDSGYRITFDYAKIGGTSVTIDWSANGDITLDSAKWQNKKLYIDGTLDAGADLETNAGDTIVSIGGGAIVLPTGNDWWVDLAYVKFSGTQFSVTGGNVTFVAETCEFASCNQNLDVHATAALNAIIRNSTIWGAYNNGAAIGGESGVAMVLNSTFQGNKYYGLKIEGAIDSIVAASTFVGNNYQEGNKGWAALDIASTGNAHVYNVLSVENNSTDNYDINLSKAGTLVVANSLYGNLGGSGVTTSACTVYDGVNITKAQIFGSSGPTLACGKVGGKDALTRSIAIKTGGTPSVAGGLGVWLRYWTDRETGALKAFQVAGDRTVASNWTTVWCSFNSGSNGDLSTTVTLDQSARSFASNLPSAGAYWARVEVPSLVVTTARDTIDGSDGETSLREALAYARRLGPKAVRQITFDYDKLTNEVLPAGWERYTIYLGKSFDDNAAETAGLNAATPLPIDGTVEILAGFNQALCMAIDAQDRDAFDVADSTRAHIVSLEVKNADDGFLVGENSMLYLEDVSVNDAAKGIMGTSTSTLVMSNASVYNVTGKEISVGEATLVNSTVAGTVETTGATTLLDATVKGGVTAGGAFKAANSIVDGAVSGASVWARFSAFSSSPAVSSTDNITGATLGLSAIQVENAGYHDVHNGFFTFSDTLAWAKNGTVVAWQYAWDWSNTGNDDNVKTPAFYYGIRENSTSSNIVPDTWKAVALGTDDSSTAGPLQVAVMGDEIGQLRLPNVGYCTMGAWTAYKAVAWKSTEDSNSVLGINGADQISRNNYYPTVQEGVDAVATAGASVEDYEGKDALYLWSDYIANEKLDATYHRVYIQKDMALVGMGTTATIISSDEHYVENNTNMGRAILVAQGKNVTLANFQVANCAQKGIEAQANATVKIDGVAILNNTTDGVYAAAGASIELVNTTLTGNNVGVSGRGCGYSMYDVTIAGNRTGIWSGPQSNNENFSGLTLVNTLVFGNETNLNPNVGNSFTSLYSITSGNDAATIFDYYEGQATPYQTPWGTQIWIAYASRAGWQGTKVAKDSSGNWYYLDRGNSNLANVNAANWVQDSSMWQWKSVSNGTVLSDPSGLTIIETDQVGRTRLACEDVGFNEYAIGAFAPYVSMEIELMDQIQEYASAPLAIESDDAVFAIKTAMASEHGQNALYYSSKDKKVYKTFNFTAPSSGYNLGSSSLADPIVGSKFTMTANVVPIEDGRQIHVKKDGSGNYEGYDAAFEDVHLFFDGAELTDAYAITLKNVDPVAEGASFTDYAKLYIVPRTVRLTLGYTQAKEYDGTTHVHVSKEGLAKAGVLNAEVAMKDDPGLDYQNANVVPAYVAAYNNGEGIITTNVSTKLVKDPAKFGFQGTQIYLDDYIIANEDYYAIILPKKVTVTATDAIKEYDGQKLVLNNSTVTANYIAYNSEDNDKVAQDTLAECLCGGRIDGNIFMFNGGTEVQLGPDVSFVSETDRTILTNEYTLARGTFTVLDNNNNDITSNFTFEYGEKIKASIVRRKIDYYDSLPTKRYYDGTMIVKDTATANYGKTPRQFGLVPVGENQFLIRDGQTNPEGIVLATFTGASYQTEHVQWDPSYPLFDENGDITCYPNTTTDVVNGQDVVFVVGYWDEERTNPKYDLTYISDYNTITWETENGADINNYEIRLHVNSKIYPRPLNITSISGAKDYNGSTNELSISAFTFEQATVDSNNYPTNDSGLVPRDVGLGLSGTGVNVSNRDATTGETTDTTTWTNLTLVGRFDQEPHILPQDYQIVPTKTYENANIDINPRPIKLYFHAVKTYDGTTDVKYLHFGALDTDTNTPLLTEPVYTYTGPGWRYILTTTVKDDSNSADTRVADKFYVTVESAQYSAAAATHTPDHNPSNPLPTLSTPNESALLYTVTTADSVSVPANYNITHETVGVIVRRPLTVEIDDQTVSYGDTLSLDNTYALYAHNGFVEQRVQVGKDFHGGDEDLGIDFDHIRAKVLAEEYNNLYGDVSDASAGYSIEQTGSMNLPNADTAGGTFRYHLNGSNHKFVTLDGEVELKAGTYVFLVNTAQQNPFAGDDVRYFRLALADANRQIAEITDLDRGTYDGSDGHWYRRGWAAKQVTIAENGTYKLHFDYYAQNNGYYFEIAYADAATATTTPQSTNLDVSGFTALYATPGEVEVPPAMGGTVTPAYQYGQFNYEGNVADTWQGITWAPAANNVLHGLTAEVIEAGDPTNPDGNRPDWDVSASGPASVLTDGLIVGDKDGLEDANVYGVSNNMVIAWTLPSPETIEAFRFYTIDEGEGGIAQQAQKININIESIQVQHSDNTWETIQGSNFYYTHGWGDLNAKKTHQLDNNAYRPYIWLYNLNEGPLAVDVCAIKVNFGTFEANSTRFAEIEALRPTGSAGGIVNELYANDIFEVTLGSDTTKTTAQSSSGFLPVGEYPDALIMESYSIVDANTQSVAGNYVVDSDKGSIIVTQRVATVTVDGTKFWKVYDGTTAVRPIDENSALVNTITGDDISIAGSFAYDNANIGTGHTITMSNITKSGSDSENYNVPTSTTGAGAVIDTLYITDPAQTPILIGSTWLNNNIPIYANTAYATNPNILHDVVEAINVTNSNGVTAWQSYVLGFNDKSGMLWIDTEQYNDTSKILAHYNALEPVAASGYTPKFALVTREKEGGYAESVGSVKAANTKFDIATGSNDPTGHYEINAYFYSNNGNLKYLGMTDDQKAAIQDKDENLAYCKSVNTLGILKAVSTNKQEMIAIPWKHLSPHDDLYIFVSNVVQTANLNENDQMYVYRPNDSMPEGVPTYLDGGYKLVWFDEFNNSGTPDPEKWNIAEGEISSCYGKDHKQEYRSSNVYCADGKLVIRQMFDEESGRYFVGKVDTSGNVLQIKRGKIVIKFQTSIAPGLRPSMTLMGLGDPWTGIGAFNYYTRSYDGYNDVILYRYADIGGWPAGTDVINTLIEPIVTGSGNVLDVDSIDDWNNAEHVAEITWDDKLTMTLDGKYSFTKDNIGNIANFQHYLEFSLPMDNSWKNNVEGVWNDYEVVDQTTHYLKIDYVRVYQKNDALSEIESTTCFDSGVYDCYLLNAQKQWSALTSYKLDAFGKVTTRTATAPEYARIPRGSAAWLVRSNNTTPIYFAGQVNTNETVTTAVEQGSVSAPKWTMLGSPSINEPFDIATITEGVVATTSASQFMDQIVVHRDGVDKIYTYENGNWGYWTTETFTRFGKTGTRSVFKTDDTLIPVGTAFWYVSRGGHPTITWRLVGTNEGSGNSGSSGN
jgi:hypothetical protein